MTAHGAEDREEKPLRVRRGRVDSVDLYEIKENELDLLEKGSPADLYLNFGIFLLSVSFSALAAISTSTFKYALVQTIFILAMIVGWVLGALLLILWKRERQSVRAVISKIRGRIPPDISVPPVVEVGVGVVIQQEEQDPKG